ncbi:DUF2357 domain-containing protein [uncultured Senegalimassilia sp.]|uniref:DUF2357 domain-containing protein n=1 Tax=uncultured Senegalimassilia sp. TaxID=1714350 RepID=UPI0025D698B0|nr:DUF2357 domain-containing protein [uncultured Senegalimassilia sp.]
MSDTIQDLYGSFAEQMGPIQEDDRYFRYLFELAQASETTIDQQREELVKVVDEEWISVIEDSLDAINNVIEKPRRFITTEQEVVPVSLAKKISADSVRHLSQNTQFLAPSDDGGVHPTKILNVSMAETYDLYENRFVYHLIQRLLTFVDRRTDVIFWSTGNEVRNRFTMHSKIGDAYEEIEYNVEMTVRDRQNFAENDADNMDTFMRIDRVRRLVMALRGSSFCQLMKGCSVVRSPIQRTNLIMKDPNYRKCFQLWQFMERYDKVGYSIQVKDSALAFDDEYLTQMYTNLINNYAVFKSLVSDDRNLTELASEQREPVVPKFIKEIKEELVDSCDIPDVEVRKVFVEEVTQAQLDAEAALEEQRGKNEELQGKLKSLKVEAHALRDECDDLAGQVDQLKQRETALTQRTQLAEAELDELRDSLEDAEAGKRAAEQDAAQARSDAQAQLERMREETAAEVRGAFDDAAAKVAAVQAEAAAAVEAAQAEAIAKVETAKAEAAAQVEAAEAEAAAQAEAAQAEAASAVAAAQAEANKAVAAAKAQGEAALAKADAQAAADREQAASELAATKAEAQDAKSRLAAAAKAHEDAASQAEQRHAQELAQAKQDFEQRLAQLNARLEQSERAKARAEKRAEGNKLSNYLRARLRGDDAPAEPGDASGAGGSASGGDQAAGGASSDEADAPSEGGRK